MNGMRIERPTSLDQVLAYRHPGVLRRYCREHDASPREAEDIFREMLKMLYVCYWAATDEAEDFGFAVSTEIEKLDWMWHTFLMYTRDYADFCERHFGFFLHHFPTDDDAADAAEVIPTDENARPRSL